MGRHKSGVSEIDPVHPSASSCNIFKVDVYRSLGVVNAVFMQGNDHTLADTKMHDLGRACSDCGAFCKSIEFESNKIVLLYLY